MRLGANVKAQAGLAGCDGVEKNLRPAAAPEGRLDDARRGGSASVGLAPRQEIDVRPSAEGGANLVGAAA